MDGFPNKKSCTWRGQAYSETRYAIIKWLEEELPKVTGDVVNIGAGNWPVPKQLLTSPGFKSYVTFDKKKYGGGKNKVNVYGDIHALPQNWSNKWDAVLCTEVIECVKNPHKAMDEIYRVIKPGGLLLLSCPYNYRYFGVGSWEDPKQGAPDYWRITENGWQILTEQFKSVEINGFGGTGPHDRFTYCVKAIK